MPKHTKHDAAGLAMTMLSAADRRQLDEFGYLVLPDFIPATMLEEMRQRVEALWAEEGDNAGAEFLKSRARGGWPISWTKGTFSRG